MRLIAALYLAMGLLSVKAQNVLPSNGYVGIGTTTPSAQLDVNGKMVVDSSVIIKDSMVVQDKLTVDKDLRIQGESVFIQQIKAKDDLKILGVTKMKGNGFVEGDFKFKSLSDQNISNDRFLLINPNGKVKSGGLDDIQAYVYEKECYPFTDVNGNVTSIPAPTWASMGGSSYGIIYTGHNCPARVGIGTNNPDVDLDVRGDVNLTGRLKVGLNSIYLGGLDQSTGSNNTIYATDDLLIQSDQTADFNTIINANNNGNVGIGITNPANKLEVAGTVRACKFIAEANSWCDFVFDEDYELMKLSDLDQFIKANKHLPEVPSEKSITEEGEVDLLDIEKLLLLKIEELTLYVIKLDENDAKLEDRLQALETK